MLQLLSRHGCLRPKRYCSAVVPFRCNTLLARNSQFRHNSRPLCSVFDDQPPKRKKQPYIKPPVRPVTSSTSLDGPVQTQWLAKALAGAGVAARRKCEDLIKEGRVKLNGKTVNELLTQVDLTKDKVQVDNVLVKLLVAPRRFYLALHKPKGYICSSVEADERGRRAVDLLKTWLKQQRQKDGVEPRLFTVGRLDVATQGLILLTNDGVWAQSIMHPKHGITKEYEVVVSKVPSRQQLQRILGGCVVDGRFVRPVRVSYLPQLSEGRGRLRVTVKDGRNREATESEALSLPNIASESYIKRNHRVAANHVQDMWLWNVREWEDMESTIELFQTKQREYDSVKRYRDGRPKRQKKHKVKGLTFKPMSSHPNVFDVPKTHEAESLTDEDDVLEWDLSRGEERNRGGAMVVAPTGWDKRNNMQSVPEDVARLHSAAQGEGWGEAAVPGAAGLPPVSKKRMSSPQGRRGGRRYRRSAVSSRPPGLALVYHPYHHPSCIHCVHGAWMLHAYYMCYWVRSAQLLRALPLGKGVEGDEAGPWGGSSAWDLIDQPATADGRHLSQDGRWERAEARGNSEGSEGESRSSTNSSMSGSASSNEGSKTTSITGSSTSSSTNSNTSSSTNSNTSSDASSNASSSTRSSTSSSTSRSKVEGAAVVEEADVPVLLDAEFFGPDGSLLDDDAIRQLLQRRRREQATQEQQVKRLQQKQEWEKMLEKKTDDFCCTEDPDWLVRVLVANGGLEVLELIRIRIGGFCLPDSLEVGQYMELQPSDLTSITDPRAQEAASKQLGNMMRAV